MPIKEGSMDVCKAKRKSVGQFTIEILILIEDLLFQGIHNVCKRIFQCKCIEAAVVIVSFLNPIAAGFQLFQGINSKPIETIGISLSSYFIIFFIQLAYCLKFLKDKQKGLFWSVFIAFVMNITLIIVIVLKRMTL